MLLLVGRAEHACLVRPAAECLASAEHHARLAGRFAARHDAAVPRATRAAAARLPSHMVAVRHRCADTDGVLWLMLHLGRAKRACLLRLAAECLATAEHHARLAGRLAICHDAAVPRATHAAAARLPSLLVAVRHRCADTDGVLGCCCFLTVLSLHAGSATLVLAAHQCCLPSLTTGSQDNLVDGWQAVSLYAMVLQCCVPRVLLQHECHRSW